MWAFSDESERGSLLLLGVLVVADRSLVDARRQLRSLLLAGQRRVHTAKESPTRRRLLLDVVGALEVSAVVLSARRPAGTSRVLVRRQLLEAAAGVARDRGVTSWVLDRQDLAQASRDRQSIARVLGHDYPLRYEHQPSHQEPLLWAVDALVWAFGAGGDWRRRVGHLIEARELGP
jgi:hypothetical protein